MMDKRTIFLSGWLCSSVHTDCVAFLRDSLERSGVRIKILSSLGEVEYRAESRANRLRRFALRWAMYVRYPCMLVIRALCSRRDSVFIVTSNTFFAPLLVALVGRVKGFKTVHLLYDLFPDALEVAGSLRVNGLISRFVGIITRLTQRLCDGSVFLGEFLAEHAAARWGESRNQRQIAIGADERHFAMPAERNANGLVFHYGGQLGRMHDAEGLVAGIERVLQLGLDLGPAADCKFNFNVSGAQSEFLRRNLRHSRVELDETVPARIWRERIREFHVGLVTLSPGGGSVCLPSKAYAMMAGGLAILAICPFWSDLATLILSNNVGWVVNNSPYTLREELAGPEYLSRIRKTRPKSDVADDFARVVKEIGSDAGRLTRMRLNARRCVEEGFGVSATGAQWSDYLQSMGVLGLK